MRTAVYVLASFAVFALMMAHIVQREQEIAEVTEVRLEGVPYGSAFEAGASALVALRPPDEGSRIAVAGYGFLRNLSDAEMELRKADNPVRLESDSVIVDVEGVPTRVRAYVFVHVAPGKYEGDMWDLVQSAYDSIVEK